jgi:hypothetical protein
MASVTVTVPHDLARYIEQLQRVVSFHGKEAGPHAPTILRCEMHVVGDALRSWKIEATVHGQAKKLEAVGNNVR